MPRFWFKQWFEPALMFNIIQLNISFCWQKISRYQISRIVNNPAPMHKNKYLILSKNHQQKLLLSGQTEQNPELA
jgi:hypothetical protein